MAVGIYKIENLINGHCYIGQSINIELRWKRHKDLIQTSDYPLYAAIRKYGIENFSFEIVQECELSQLDELEVYWIKYYNSYYDGYNQTLGGDQHRCIKKVSDEDLLEIIQLLQTSELSQNDIAKRFGVGIDTISEINNGKTRVIDNVTYPIRQKKHKEFKCEMCGITISCGSTLCSQCSGISHRKTERPTKDELFNLLQLNNGNFSKVSNIFNMTDNAIRRWCDTYNLPRKSKDYKQYN